MAANPHNPKYAAVNPKYAVVNSLPSAVGVRGELLQEKWLVKQLHKFLPPIISSQFSLAPPLMLLQQVLLHGQFTTSQRIKARHTSNLPTKLVCSLLSVNTSQQLIKLLSRLVMNQLVPRVFFPPTHLPKNLC